MDSKNIPAMLYADSVGQIYEHPHYGVLGFSGDTPTPLRKEDLIPMPEFSKLFYIPDCPPVGLNLKTGTCEVVSEVKMDGVRQKCQAVAAFLEPGLVRTHLPAADYRAKSYTLPLWAYTAVGFEDDRYWAAAYRVEYNRRWDPRNYDDRELIPAIEAFRGAHGGGPLVDHLITCATENHCFAAKNLFLGRWEAPLPVSRGCNASCLGCLSIQPDDSCDASHERISFKPSKQEIVSLAVAHLNGAPAGIVSFGQGCEGEPLTEYRLIAESVKEIRERTDRGTINLNTNGSKPERVRLIARRGLDSIRISLNSARPDLYRAYFRPMDYDFDDVESTIGLSKASGLYTMVNYLVFPGINDQEEEIEAMIRLVKRTGVNFVHLKNLNIDPQVYLDRMPRGTSKAVGMKGMVETLKKECLDLEVGYFNQPLR